MTKAEVVYVKHCGRREQSKIKIAGQNIPKVTVSVCARGQAAGEASGDGFLS